MKGITAVIGALVALYMALLWFNHPPAGPHTQTASAPAQNQATSEEAAATTARPRLMADDDFDPEAYLKNLDKRRQQEKEIPQKKEGFDPAANSLSLRDAGVKLDNVPGTIPINQVTRDSDVAVVGTVDNNSNDAIHDLRIAVLVKDCPWLAGECRVVGELDSPIAAVDISPHQTRTFQTDTTRFRGLVDYDPKYRRELLVQVLEVDPIEKWLEAKYQARLESERQAAEERAKDKEARLESERQAAEERAKAEEEKRKKAEREEQQRQERARQAAAARQAAIEAEAERKAAALRDATINPADLSVNVIIRGEEGFGVPWISGTVVNHSNKTLRATEIKVQVRDCPQCLVTNEWDRKFVVDVPPGQQRNFGFDPEAWRMANDGKSYTWRLLTASACSWYPGDSTSHLVCP